MQTDADDETSPARTTAGAGATPFAQQTVTLTRQAYIELVMAAKQWKSLHERATARAHWAERRHQHEIEKARLRELGLREELALARAQILDLRQRVFGVRTEQSMFVAPSGRAVAGAPRPRGQQRGRPGHGRRRAAELPARCETIELDAVCPKCGQGLSAFPGTEDSEVVELEVKAYRRVIRRQRYRPTCRCGCLAGIVTAPLPPRLIPRGKLGVSVWVNVLLSKFSYGQPTHRLLHDWFDQGLRISQGTITDGLRRLAPLFEPLGQAWSNQLRAQSHWHADETRWEVFVEHEGKIGHRWYLWVFQAQDVVQFILDPSRSARVPGAALRGVESGILSVDRYAAYKKFATQTPGISLSYCWAHQRRDFLRIANDHPALWSWAMDWVDQVGLLYHLHGRRRQAYGDAGCIDTAVFIERDRDLREAVNAMQRKCDDALGNSLLATPARKVLQSLKAHWSGLVVFVEHPWLDLDNNAAERALRAAVVGRKNFYGSGSQWSGELAATVMSLLMTTRLWKINARTWLIAYLQACADSGGRPPAQLSAFVPWQMSASQLATMRASHRGFDAS
ncbi:IS66 family transposase [Variovorax sp. LjRoot84]|uniref:IS66 family transposase n=1 Tax=Variovorax sp. LjRoot84 TaxID=3342340 RepID=UPI003F514E00